MISSPKRVRILVIDDSELVRMGLRSILASHPGIVLVGEADSAAAGRAALEQHHPDVVLLDLRLPDGDGSELCRSIRRSHPETRVLILTSMLDASSISSAITAGAQGYLVKDIDGQSLVQGILDVAAGRTVLAPAITSQVMELMRTTEHEESLRKRYELLSPQEQRVLSHVARGLTNKEIAGELGLSDKTVKNYVSNLLEKLQISRRSQAVAIFAELNQ
jgi:two-component system response regulator DevR